LGILNYPVKRLAIAAQQHITNVADELLSFYHVFAGHFPGE
jgi:hypothetical protein